MIVGGRSQLRQRILMVRKCPMGWKPMIELGFSSMSWLTRPEKGLILVVQMQDGQVLALCRASVHQGSWRM